MSILNIAMNLQIFLYLLDTDECLTGAHNCSTGSVCLNVENGYTIHASLHMKFLQPE